MKHTDETQQPTSQLDSQFNVDSESATTTDLDTIADKNSASQVSSHEFCRFWRKSKVQNVVLTFPLVSM